MAQQIQDQWANVPAASNFEEIAAHLPVFELPKWLREPQIERPIPNLLPTPDETGLQLRWGRQQTLSAAGLGGRRFLREDLETETDALVAKTNSFGTRDEFPHVAVPFSAKGAENRG